MRTIHVACVAAAMCLSGGAAARAQTAPSRFLSVNFGTGQPSPNGFSSGLKDSSEPGVAPTALQTDYHVKSAPTFDIGGGVFVRPRMAVGIAVAHYTDKQPANVALTLPSPINPTQTVSSSLQSGPLERDETGVHIQVGYRIPTNGAVSLLLFGGPSYITARQQFVSMLNLASSSFDPRTGTFAFKICCLQTESEKASAWGYNVGADFGYFMTKAAGVGGMVRYSRTTVDLTNPILSEARGRTVTEPVDVGGVNIGAGLRLRF